LQGSGANRVLRLSISPRPGNTIITVVARDVPGLRTNISFVVDVDEFVEIQIRG
jgi:hypothetical protein